MSGNYLLLGASSELCLAFLRCHLWKAEDRIVAHYCHSKEQLEKIQQEIPAQMELIQADFQSMESTKALAEHLAAEAFVPTHILHVPAVPIANQRFTEITWEEAEQQLSVQCRSLMLVLQSVIKGMSKAKAGKIIIGLSSYSMNVPPKFLSAYVMAKYALMGLGKALAVEYAPKGIQVNMISPSMMETRFLENVHETVVAKSAQGNPTKRNAKPEDVAQVIEFLFSEANTFVIGANIPVTGGETF